MAAMDEKAEAQRTSNEVSKTSQSLKEQDPERSASHIPQSDEEYNVTPKTWCVVIVSLYSVALLAPTKVVQDPVVELWNIILDRPILECLRCRRCNIARRPDQGGLVCVAVYDHGHHRFHGLRSKQRFVRSKMVHCWRQSHTFRWFYSRRDSEEQYFYAGSNVTDWFCELHQC